MKLLTIPTVMFVVLLSLPALAATSASTLPNGTPIDVTVEQPIDGTEYVMPPGGVSLDVEGTASVGFGIGGAKVVYVLDVSGSVTNDAHADCGGDFNSDGLVNTILDCEIAGVLALNGTAVASGSVDEVGLAVYGRFGAAADMKPDAGVQLITEPNAGPGDVETVARSVVALASAGPTQYTAFNVSNSQTNFAAGLAAATNIVNASTNETNIVVFLSDGLSNFGGFDFDGSLGQLAATGAVVHAYAVGVGSSCAFGSDGTLQQIATATNGTCTEVEDPSQLAGLLSGLLDSSLDHLELSVDGEAATTIPNENITPMLPQDGPVQVTYSTPLAGLGLGVHTMCVTAFGHDGGGEGESGPACTTVYVYGIELTPASAVKEVGVDSTHTLVATIGGEAGWVGDRLVTFTVIDGPNAGTTGTGMTDAGGSTPWTYTNAGAGGTDTIEACFTVADPTGITGCTTATVEWLDTTPPIAACLPGPNPHGSTIPPAGWSSLPGPKGGQNEDGFYDLIASDAVDPNPLVFAIDGGTGHVFGPYPDGTVVKWTQAPGAIPSERPMGSTNGRAGAVEWHLRGQGDLLVYAVDASGNASIPLACLVPPLPK